MEHDSKQKPANRISVDILDGLRRIDLAIRGAETSEQFLANALDAMLDIFECDRAWLLYPCTLDAEYFTIPQERSRPGFEGAGATLEKIPMDPWISTIFKLALAADRPIAFDAFENHPEEFNRAHETLDRFQIKSQLLLSIHPRGDDPWLLGIHNCSHAADYTEAKDLFQAIGQRIADGVTSMIAAEQLRQSEQRFKTLVYNAPEAIVLLDCDSGIFTDVNKKAEQLFGWSRAELLGGMGPAGLSPKFQSNGMASSEATGKYIEHALSGGFPTFEWDHIHSSGKVVPCEVTLAYLPHPTKRILRGSVTDISARKLAEEKRRELESHLAQLQKMEAIGNLTGGIAHDFNNLLTVIFGNLDLLEMEPENTGNVQLTAGHIRSAAERASSLTHRLLAFARRQPLRPQVLDVGHLLRGMDDLLRRTIGEAIAVELVVSGGLWLCEIDKAQLESAILNLAINARDAMPEGGKLTLEASNASLDAEYALTHREVESGQYVLIAVSDSGTGMTPEILDQAFSPFFTTKEVGKGTGLGLSMVYGFVKQSGGHLKAYSEIDVGTTMKIYLPRTLSQETTPTKGPHALQSDHGSGELVLVVEDEESVLELTSTLLQHLGYRTLEAPDAAVALKLLEAHPEIDMLLTDVVLAGGMNGAQLAKIALEKRPELKVLYMSGYTANAIIHNGNLDSHVTLLEKPFTKRSLAMLVREVLQK